MSSASTLDLSPLGPQLLPAVIDIARRVRDAGGRALMVGGSVRDLLLGSTAVKDVDIEVFGLSPDALQRLLAGCYPFDPCGVSFGVLKLRHLDIDVSLPRRESKRGEGHRAFMIESDPSLSIPEAASRRDFTVNALYYDPLDSVLEDPYGGVADLDNRILRHVSPKFVEDPLRVLRGMQFVARFGLAPAPETIALCRTIPIEGLAAERLYEEWAKLLTKGIEIGRGLEFLKATGWVGHFPELAALIGCRQDPDWHPEGDVWEHTKLCLDAFARHRIGDAAEDVLVGLAVVCHDFGKPATSFYDPVRKRIRSLGHDEAGVAPTLSFLKRLTNEERLLKEIPPLVKHHMSPFSMWKSKSSDAAIRRLAMRVGRIDRLVRVARADSEGRGGDLPNSCPELDWLTEAAERLRIADAMPKPLLLGRHLIALGYRPSQQFGVWLAKAFEAQLDGAFCDIDGAIAWFKNHVTGAPSPQRNNRVTGAPSPQRNSRVTGAPSPQRNTAFLLLLAALPIALTAATKTIHRSFVNGYPAEAVRRENAKPRQPSAIEQLCMSMLPQEKAYEAAGFFAPVYKKYKPQFERFARAYESSPDKMSAIRRFLPTAERALAEARKMPVPPRYEQEKQNYLKVFEAILLSAKLSAKFSTR